ncbi:MAG: carboxypeptidase-like regulatory domain-containing protein [Cyclobacteriaceae bacterium]
MKNLILIPLMSFSILFSGVVLAQVNSQLSIKVVGNITDADLHQPIGFAHITTNEHSGTISDAKGDFNIIAKPGDTLVITHAGYLTSKVSIPQDYAMKNFRLNLQLQSGAQMLENVDVVNFLPIDIEEFKEAFLLMDADHVMAMENFNRNSEKLKTQLGDWHYDKIEMSGYENYRNQEQGPRGVNLLGIFDIFSGKNKSKNK